MSRPRLKPETVHLQNTIILHPDFEVAMDALRMCHKTSGYDARGTVIYGDPGVGKSTLLKAYKKQFPDEELPDRTTKPIVYFKGRFGRAPTTKMVQQRVLSTMGIPYKGRDTEADLTDSLAQNFKDLDVQMVLLDEFQDILKRSRDSEDIIHFIKQMMDDTNVPWVLAGIEEVCDFMDRSDDQIQRRWHGAYSLDAFSITTDDEMEDFACYMELIEENLPFRCPSLLEKNMLLRIYLATKGVPGLISDLMTMLVEFHDGKSAVTLKDFTRAHRLARQGSRRMRGSAPFARDPFDLTPSELRRITGAM